MQFSANLSLLFTDLPLLERLLAARLAGFDGVEIQDPYPVPAISLDEGLRRAGIPLRVINLPAGDFYTGGPGLAAVPGRQGAFVQAVERAATYAAMARPALVNVLVGRLAQGVTPREAHKVLVDNLRLAAERFAVLGIGVTCEAINPLDVPGYLINTPEQLLALLDQVGHPNLSALLDIYHLARQGLDMQRAIGLLAGRIGHVQFADWPGRGAPGTGQLDFQPLVQALLAVGYQGWLGAEYLPKGATQDSLAWLEQFKRWG